jgi:leucyl-tRNA synthetase
MEWLNYLTPQESISKLEYKNLILMLAPFAPHITEELWQMIGEEGSVHNYAWPVAEERYLNAGEVNIAVQINGKVREVLHLSHESANDQKGVEKAALESQVIKKHLDGKIPKKIIYVPGKILSLVV